MAIKEKYMCLINNIYNFQMFPKIAPQKNYLIYNVMLLFEFNSASS